MNKQIYKFSSTRSNIFMTIFTFIFFCISYIVIFYVDERNIFVIILSIIISLLSLLTTIYLWINKLIVREDKLIYIGFKKHIILKKDIKKIKTDGLRITIETKHKKYIIAGYYIDGTWNKTKQSRKNIEFVNYLNDFLFKNK